MNKDKKLVEKFFTEWLKALRSGKYKQGYGRLRTKVDDTYCCLGVACVVAKDLGILTEMQLAQAFSVKNNVTLPKALTKVIGIGESGEFERTVGLNGDTYVSLTNLNDGNNGAGAGSFRFIALTIERALKSGNFEKV